MKIAVLGGGFTGITAAYTLAKNNHKVVLFEKSPVLGGLAVGFKQPNWDWHLERAYHHLFANDTDILNFAVETGFNKIYFKAPITASLFNDIKILPMDTPIDFLKLPYLDLFNKFRAGAVLAFLKVSPFFTFYEKKTAEEFIKLTMGKTVWVKLWQELFRKKFGDYAGIILASFIWARINKRTKNLGYVEGGFQTFINHLVEELKSLRVNVLTGYEINEIEKRGDKFSVNGQIFDKVISTLPTPIMVRLTTKIFPEKYLAGLAKIKYLHAMTLILETRKPILEKIYWLNVSAASIPIMGIVQHTNFTDKKNYGNNHLTYLAWYLKRDDKRIQMKDQELLSFVKPYIKKIKPGFDQKEILNYYTFRAPFAQPIFDKVFLENKPDFNTPLKNFYIANLDMTYPYDRGTNYAVKLGKEVAAMI